MHAKTLRCQCAVVGAGLAGIATAFQLTRRGLQDVVILESESAPGQHSSGRNAAMIRQVVADPRVAALTTEGAEFISRARTRWKQPELFHQTGSLLLAGHHDQPNVQRSLETARRQGVRVEWHSREQIERTIDVVQGGDFEGAICTPSDGTVDTHALLHGYLRHALAAGARFFPNRRVTEILLDDSKRVQGLRAESYEVITPRVVNAAGAWASSVAELAGAAPIPLTPYRRHLFHTGPYPEASPDWPFVWHLDHDVYFRPESGGLLLSPCDRVATGPCLPEADPEAVHLLATKLESAFPALTEVSVQRSWCGLRTFAPDENFVIGPDPVVRGFFWVAGLGGHGVTTSAAVGALAAETILDPPSDRRNHFSPSRFVEETSAQP